MCIRDRHNTGSSKPVLGALSVPIYVYDCPLENLLEFIVLKSEYVKNYKDHYMKRVFKSVAERGFHHIENDRFEILELKSDDSESAQGMLLLYSIIKCLLISCQLLLLLSQVATCF